MSNPEQHVRTQREQNPIVTEIEQYETRVERRLATRALTAATFLAEIDTVHSDERDFLHDYVVGQETAIDVIVKALDRQEVRLPDDHRPIASFAFLGPTGVGKTQVARVLAKARAVDGAEPNLIKIDSSQYSEGHEVTRLLGSPPSFVGSDITPQFSPSNIEREGTVVLFDEIEKGHDKLHNLLLQVMGDGQLSLNNGKTVSFRDTILIMTSNLGAGEIVEQTGLRKVGFVSTQDSKTPNIMEIEKSAIKSFKDYFKYKPEFTNRLTEMVVFHPLTEGQMYQVLDSKISEMNEAYVDNFGAYLSLSQAAKEHLVNTALTEPENGVRPLMRGIEKEVNTYFGRYLKAGKIGEGTQFLVFHRDEVKEYLEDLPEHEMVFAFRPDARVKKKIIPVSKEVEVFVEPESTPTPESETDEQQPRDDAPQPPKSPNDPDTPEPKPETPQPPLEA